MDPHQANGTRPRHGVGFANHTVVTFELLSKILSLLPSSPSSLRLLGRERCPRCSAGGTYLHNIEGQNSQAHEVVRGEHEESRAGVTSEYLCHRNGGEDKGNNLPCKMHPCGAQRKPAKHQESHKEGTTAWLKDWVIGNRRFTLMNMGDGWPKSPSSDTRPRCIDHPVCRTPWHSQRPWHSQCGVSSGSKSLQTGGLQDGCSLEYRCIGIEGLRHCNCDSNGEEEDVPVEPAVTLKASVEPAVNRILWARAGPRCVRDVDHHHDRGGQAECAPNPNALDRRQNERRRGDRPGGFASSRMLERSQRRGAVATIGAEPEGFRVLVRFRLGVHSIMIHRRPASVPLKAASVVALPGRHEG